MLAFYRSTLARRATPSRRRDAVALGHGRAQLLHVPLPDDLWPLSGTGHGAHHRRDPGRSEHLLSGDEDQVHRNCRRSCRTIPRSHSVVGFTGGRADQHRLRLCLAEALCRAQGHRRRGGERGCAASWRGRGRASLHVRGLGLENRRAAEQRGLSIYAALRRHDGALRMGAEADGGADGQRHRQGRQFRPAARRPADRPHDRPRHRDAARPDPERDRQHALRRLRPAAGVGHLQRAQPVSRRDGGRAALLAGSAHARADLRFDRPAPIRPASSRPGSPPAITCPRPGRRSTAATIAADSARNLATNALAASGHSAASTGAAVSTSVETMVPLSAFAKYAPGHTPLNVNHQGQFAASTISFNLAPGRALSEAKTEIDNAIQRIDMPSTVRGAFAGTAATFQQSQSSMPLLFGAALVTIYIVLGILYESLIHPITILSTLFSASVGAALALMAVRHAVHRHRRDRRAAAHRHREEERDHDGRLRARSGASGARHARGDRSRPASCASVRS